MVERQVIADELAEMAPGMILGAVLGAIDPARVNGHDLVTVLQAMARQVAHWQGRMLAVVGALAHRPPGRFDAPVAWVEQVDEFAADEVAAALRWTRNAAGTQLGLALDVCDRMPALGAALLAGEIDLPRARVICDALADVDTALARATVARVLPQVELLTTGRLAARLRKMVMAADPDEAAKRHHRSVDERRMACLARPDGTATIFADGLPADRAVAATERINAMAKAAKRAGDGRTMDQLRTDTFLDLLCGTHAGSGPVHRAGVVELTVPLTTLMQLADAPGEIAGFGPVIADIARQIVREQPTAQWRWSVFDPQTGRLLQHGSTRRRPTTVQAQRIRARDRRCRFPGCGMPAVECDIDHTQRFADGGVTEDPNLGPFCRHHHRGKDDGDWAVRQVAPGVFAWRSPQDRMYLVAPDPVELPCAVTVDELSRAPEVSHDE